MQQQKTPLMPYVIIGGMLSASVLAGMWMIRNEGEKTREAMRSTVRDATNVASDRMHEVANDTVKDTLKEGLDEARKGALQLPGVILKEAGNMLGNELDRQTERRGDDDKDEPRKRDGDDAGQARNSERPRSERSRPQDLIQGIFNAGNEAARRVDDVAQDALGLDDTDEKEIGAKMHESILKSLKVSDRPEAKKRVEEAAAPFLKKLKRSQVRYTFTVIDDDEINAFSIPGGYIYVHSGLVDFAKEKHELQFVMGHEIGHVDLKHCLRNHTYATRAGEVGGDLAQVAFAQVYHVYELSFSETHEFEADEYSYRAMLAQGFSKEETLAFPERLLKLFEEKGIEPADPKKPASVLDALGRGLASHFESHPPTRERLERLKKLKVK